MTASCAIALVLACNSRESESRAASRRHLEIDAIAAVGDRVLTRHQLETSAIGKCTGPAQFVNGWVKDALLAEAARNGLLDPAHVRQIERSVLARAQLEWTYNRSIDSGIPTDAEVAKITAERWFEVDRPAAAKTTHFVVRVPAGHTPIAAQKLARKIAGAVRGLVTPEAFLAAARAVPSDGLEVVAESLPPVTSDGRSLQLDKAGNPVGEGPHFDESFARAANSVESEGGQSGLVQSAFGYHVILLERKIAPHHVPMEDRRRSFAAEVYARRARALADGIVDAGKKRRSVQIETSFQETVTKLQVLP